MRNPFKRQQKAVTATSAVIEAINSGWSPYPALGGGSLQRISDAFNTAQGANYAWQYQHSPAVRTVIDFLVRNIGSLDLRLYEELSQAERQPRPEHPAALSLRYPMEGVSGDRLVRSLLKDYLIHDNAYALILPGPNNQVALQRIPAYMVEVQSETIFRAENYRIWKQGAWSGAGTWGGSGDPIDLPPENVMHWHGEHPIDPRVGLSRLDTLTDVIAEDAALAQAIIELASNGLQAPIWVSRPVDAPEMKAETARAHEEDIANRLRNRNRIPPLMMEGEALQSFGTSPQDAQMMEVRRWAIQRVAAVFGVPNAAVGLEPATPDSTNQLYNDTLPPYCDEFTRFLNQRLLVDVYDWRQGCFEFNLDEKTGWSSLPVLIGAAGRPIMTLNEARAKINQPPQPGGDKVITPLNVTDGANPKPSVNVMPIQDPNRPPQDGSYRSDQPLPPGDGSYQGERPGGKAVEEAERSQLEQARAEGKRVKFASHESRRARALRRQRRNIARFERTVGNFLTGRLAPKLKAMTVETKQTETQPPPSPAQDAAAGLAVAAGSRKMEQTFAHLTGDLSSAIGRVIREVVGAEGALTAAQLGATFDLAKTVNYRKAMADGSAQQLLDVIRQEAADNGIDWALGRLPQHAASAGASLGARSTIWARQEAGRQSPQPDHVLQETWVKDTERHAQFDGTSVPLGGTWQGGLRPGNTPGCRCTSLIQ